MVRSFEHWNGTYEFHRMILLGQLDIYRLPNNAESLRCLIFADFAHTQVRIARGLRNWQCKQYSRGKLKEFIFRLIYCLNTGPETITFSGIFGTTTRKVVPIWRPKTWVQCNSEIYAWAPHLLAEPEDTEWPVSRPKFEKQVSNMIWRDATHLAAMILLYTIKYVVLR
jgi:hypothetical protein